MSTKSTNLDFYGFYRRLCDEELKF